MSAVLVFVAVEVIAPILVGVAIAFGLGSGRFDDGSGHWDDPA